MTAERPATTQAVVYHQLAEIILGVHRAHPARVAIDGIDAAGKTTLADRLVRYLEPSGRPIIRASIDGYHNPKRVRYRRGRESATGYFYDSFNLEAVRSELLDPLGPHGDRRYLPQIFDYETDSVVDAPLKPAAPNAILLFDGVFLCQPALLDCWDLVIFLKISFETGLARGVERNRLPAGEESGIRRMYRVRYHGGQRIYLQSCSPLDRADVVVDNEDFNNPKIVDLRLSRPQGG